MIVHICTHTEWKTALKNGEYWAASLSSEGFIHCSRPDQILEVANAFYSGLPELILLWIDPEKVAAEVRWEPPVDPGAPSESQAAPAGVGELFPHIYGPLNLEAVTRVAAFLPDEQGVFRQVPG